MFFKHSCSLLRFTEWFAVLINPQNPEIQEFLHPLLTDARKHLDAGEKFCLKVKTLQLKCYRNRNCSSAKRSRSYLNSAAVLGKNTK